MPVATAGPVTTRAPRRAGRLVGISQGRPTLDRHEPGGGSAPQGDYHGAESVANDVFSTIPEHFDEFEARPDGFIDGSEHLVVVGVFHGKSKAGHRMQARYAHVWKMRDGKAISFNNHVEAAPWAEGWSAS